MKTTRRLLRAALLALGLSTAAGALAQKPGAKPDETVPPLSRFTSETLSRFENEAEFDLYLRAVDEAEERRDRRYGARRTGVQYAAAAVQDAVQSDAAQEPVCTDPELCPDESQQGLAEIMVTGSRIATSNPSITNVQMAGVDEGDIVKQIGNFLIVLQDGRLFVVDLRPGGGQGLRLVDRADVYRTRGTYAWYDEMLVQGDRIVVTAYSYGEQASELSVFRLDEAGRIHREGVFLISSDDYYSATNYATRLVGDSLVVYTPYSLDRWEDGNRAGRWPTVRRWLPEQERREAMEAGTRLFDAARVYRPVRDEIEPEIHTVSVCPLGPVEAGRDLACRTTAFVGPSGAQLYVTNDHAYLWTNDTSWRPRLPRCNAQEEGALSAASQATVYRVGIASGALEVLGARGRPVDQFSFQANESRLYGLLRQHAESCRPHTATGHQLGFASLPLDRFGQRLREVPEADYTDVPAPHDGPIANRFTDRYLVYGSLSEGAGIRNEDYRVRLPRTFAVPVDRPAAVRSLAVPHNVLRAERAGDDIVLTGYRDREGLHVSLVDLDRAPRVASTAFLPKRFESEGRSHAFNSRMEGDGSGIMGLPTVYYDSSRPVSRSEASDLSFLTADRAGRLAPAGELKAEDERHHPTYRCEVSCIDWYGNSRPIFTDGRIFGLSGTELVEGRMEGGRIGEIGRLDLSAPPERRP
ncbi:MAG TPA: beta-propeller domain-containing protein [Allosphingosinicella sp.]|jgi:hypothetical protein